MGDVSRRNPLICTRPRFGGAGKEEKLKKGTKTVSHGISTITGGYSDEDLEKVKERIKVGDILNYPLMQRDGRSAGVLIYRWSKVRVTAKYPHLVTVVGVRRKFPVLGITYSEILADPRITDAELPAVAKV